MVAFRWTSVLPLVFSFTILKVNCKFEFTNINCTSLDEAQLGVDECFLKSVNRTYKYMTMRLKFHKLPINNVTGKVRVLNRLNGYKPFLYDIDFDACKFLKGRKNNVLLFIYDLFAPYSNINHSCPYNHDIYIEKLPMSYLSQRLSVVLPMPEGYYCLHTIYSVSGKRVFDIKVYGKIY